MLRIINAKKHRQGVHESVWLMRYQQVQWIFVEQASFDPGVDE